MAVTDQEPRPTRPGLCPCRFDGWDLGLWSSEWHRAHKAAHLAAFPDVDPGTVENLDMFVRIAEERETR